MQSIWDSFRNRLRSLVTPCCKLNYSTTGALRGPHCKVQAEWSWFDLDLEADLDRGLKNTGTANSIDIANSTAER